MSRIFFSPHVSVRAKYRRFVMAGGGREYPLDWITRQMGRSGMVVTAAKKMPVLYAPHTVKRQVGYDTKHYPRVGVGALAGWT